jgi:putative membrane protein
MPTMMSFANSSHKLDVMGEAAVRPYVVMMTFLLIGAAGFMAAGAIAEDLPMTPPLSRAPSASQQAGDDEAFARKAAEGGAAEVALAELAQKKATDDSVKRAAARIGADHVKANQTLQLLAAQKGWQLPSTPGAEAQATHDRLEKLSGAEFDRAYIDAMVRDHQADIKAFEREAAHGTDEAVKRFASGTLPTLREHLEMSLKAQRALPGTRP